MNSFVHLEARVGFAIEVRLNWLWGALRTVFILSLRDKLKAKQGANYNQLAFHDAFMKLPYPVSIIESILLEG